MSWRRIGIAFAAVVAAAALAIVAAVFWVFETERGTRWALTRALAFAGSAVTVERIGGTLGGTLALDGLVVTLGGGERIAIDRVGIRIDAIDWLGRHVAVGALDVGDVDYRSGDGGASEDGDEAAGGFELPLALDVADAALARLRIETDGGAFEAGPARASIGLAGSRLTLTGLDATAAGVDVQGDFELGFGEALSLVADAAWSTVLDGRDWSGDVDASGTLASLDVRARLASPVALGAEGTLALSAAPRADVVVVWDALAWPGFDLARAGAGRLRLTGWTDSVEFAGAAAVVVDGIDGDVEASGTATPQRIVVDGLRIETAHGSADATGAVDLSPLAADLSIDARSLDPSVRVADWAGAIDASGRVTVATTPALEVAVAGLTADGTLRGQPIAASGDLQWRSPRGLRLGGVMLAWAGNEARVDGRVDGAAGGALDLDVHVDAPDLGIAGDGLAGRVAVDGSLEGTVDAPSFVGTAEAEGLSARGFSVAAAHVEAAIEGIETPVLNVRLDAEDVRRGEQPLARTVSAVLRGTPASHTLAVDADAALGRARLDASGGLDAGNWAGEVGRLTVDQDLLGQWALDQPVRVAAGTGGLRLERACLTNAPSSFCAEAVVGNGDERVSAELEAFELRTLQSLLREPVSEIEGRYDASLDLAGPLRTPTGSFSVTGDSTLIRIVEQGAPLDLPIERVRVDGTLDAEQFAMSGSIVGPRDASARFEATVTDVWTPSPSIDARVDGRWDDLAVLSALSPDVGEVSGTATVGLEFAGALAAPVVSGEARLAGGRVAVPRWGFLMEEIEVVATSPDARRLDYRITGRAGGGRAELTGSTQLDPAERWPTRMTLSGTNLQAVQVPEAEITISPSLEVEAQWPVIEVSGVVAVPSARLTLEDLPEQSVATSADAVVHGSVERPAPARPLDLRADLQVVLGDDVSFVGAGLDADLTGQLGLQYRSGENAVGSGAVFVGGQYNGFGRSFDLERGRLLFTGPVDDPGLDVLAVREIAGTSPPVTVGVQLGGTVKAPTTRLYSEPAMADADVLSYLVIGRPLSESREENTEALQAAAISLGLTQAVPQIQHFGESIGLDELSVRTSEANTGELMAGKQLSSRVYARYTYGLFNRVGGLLLRFRLTDNLDLEARTGDYQAMDLLYTIEKE